MTNNYYIGLDLGTNSVGWAVTDEEYRLIKKRGRDLWGSYLFDTANTAKERRSHRSVRRRYARSRTRIKLLQELFAEEIATKDPAFFIRLENSRFFPEDKAEPAKDSFLFFYDKDFTDKDYHKQYPTIFHLRKALMNDEIHDIRLLYIAVHHIIKNRGHFYFEDQNFDSKGDDEMKNSLIKINEFLKEESEDSDVKFFPSDKHDKMLEILYNDRLRKSDKER